MEEKFMSLAGDKFRGGRNEAYIDNRDKTYDQVDICRQLARFGERYGEMELRKFFDELTECVKEEK